MSNDFKTNFSIQARYSLTTNHQTMRYLLATILLFLLCFACRPESQYQRVLSRELAKEARHDSLFLDLRLGMSGKDFFARCWELNRQQVLTDGVRNTAIQYKLEEPFESPVSMNFYPAVHDERVYEIKLQFMHLAWAPWNKQYWSDKLIVKIVDLLEEWYGGNPFFTMGDGDKKIYVKIDGNRRIMLHCNSDTFVNGRITDMTATEALDQARKKGLAQGPEKIIGGE